MKYYCPDCKTDFDTPRQKIISGTKGHIDDWLPDEVYQWCPDCGSPEFDDAAYCDCCCKPFLERELTQTDEDLFLCGKCLVDTASS